MRFAISLLAASIAPLRKLDVLIARRKIAPVTLNLCVASLLLGLHNQTFILRATDMLPGKTSLLALLAAAFALTLALTALVAGFYAVRLQKAMLAALLLVCAVASFFTDRFGVLIDAQMVANLGVARPDEALDLLSQPLALHLGLYGVLPALLVLRLRVVKRGLLPEAAIWLATMALGLALCVALILSQYSTFASFRAPQRDRVVLALQPYAVLSAGYVVARQALQPAPAAPTPIALDARRPATKGAPPRFVLVVVGESARAASFGLGGYARDTTPELARRDVIYYPDTGSCGTATATSLPCIFSHLASADFTISESHRFENVLDVAARTGMDLHWIENNREHYGVAARLPVLNFADNGRSDHCPTQRCPDTILLPDVQRLIAQARTDTLLVVHLVGSHITYTDRYPPEFEHFAPVCTGADLSSCPRAHLVNGYDNSIRFTDHVLAQMIDALAARPDLATAMVYTSDHGESLGEHGLFAHSTPMLLAPPEQTRVPLLLWLSQPYTATTGLDPACLRARAQNPASHDALFHTLLGLTGIDTTARDPALDLTAPCLPANGQ